MSKSAEFQAKGGKGTKKHFESQAENCEVYVQIYMSLSVCLHLWAILMKVNWPKEK